MNFLVSLFFIIKYVILEKKKRVFFFENKFIETHILKNINKKDYDKSLALFFYKTDISKRFQNKLLIENKFLIEFFFLFILKCKYLYSSTPDLDNSIFKRSIIFKIKYIYIQHSNISLTIAYSQNAFIFYDAIHVLNMFQYSEIIQINNIHKKKIKPFLLNQRKIYKSKIINQKKKILIAPTWGTDFYEENFIYNLNNLLNDEFNLFLRPHYMSVAKNKIILKDYSKYINLAVEEFNLNEYDFLITDSSGIMFEFFLINYNKIIFIETTKKINNPDYKKYGIIPIELYAKDKIGKIFQKNQILDIKNYLTNSKDNTPSDILPFKKLFFF